MDDEEINDLEQKGDPFAIEDDDAEDLDDSSEDNNVYGEDEEDLEQEDEEDEPPFNEPRGQRHHLNPTHPDTDTNIEEHELYDEGLEGAAETNLPPNEETLPGFSEEMNN